ncbi:5351_t:CDS:1, partial [Dentiscutata heterogama]
MMIVEKESDAKEVQGLYYNKNYNIYFLGRKFIKGEKDKITLKYWQIKLFLYGS